MKLRFPLSLQIVFWLCLNLAVLAIGFALLFQSQFGVGYDSLLAGKAGQRLTALSRLIAFDLGRTPLTEWNEVLERYGEAYGITFHLLGEPRLSETVSRNDLPDVVRDKLPPPFTGPAGRGPQMRERLRPSADETTNTVVPLPSGRPGRGQGRLAPYGSPAFPPFLVRSRQPTRYWAGIPLSVPGLPPGRARRPLVLLAESESLHAGGLFFDPSPWWALVGGSLLVSALIWLPWIRHLTRSIHRLTAATEHIGEGQFEVRVTAHHRDEIGQLGAAVNRLAERLNQFVSGQQRFLGDIAHELCSPVARMQVAVGILEQKNTAADPSYLQDLREELDAMADLLNELLSFSKTSLQPESVKAETVELLPLLNEILEREGLQSEQLQLEIDPQHAVSADTRLLRRALANLLRNAKRYAGSKGPIELRSRLISPDRLQIRIRDHGPGIDEAALQRIFDPFFRPDPSRDRRLGGVGLGLAIVKTCVEAGRGTVTARNHSEGGLEITLDLPRA